MTPENAALVKKLNEAIAMVQTAAEGIENALTAIVEDLTAGVSDEEMTEVSQPDPPPVPAPKSKAKAKPTKPVITEDDVRRELAAKSRDGFTARVKEILTNHGVAKVSELDPEHYAAVIAAAKEIK